MYRLFIILIFIFYSLNLQAQGEKTGRTINFAGMDWHVRSGQGNPGNNLWSDDEKSVWVDHENRLHLKIRKINGKWHAAEIISLQPTQHGIHKFYIANRVDLLDKNIVGAVFIYKDDLHEMDIEFSKWKYDDIPNSQYVVQPEQIENVHKFDTNLNGDYSTHIINWQPDFIAFQSYHGHHISLPSQHFLIDNWQYNQKKLPDDGRYKIHINLWMVDNQAPSDEKEAELIIASMDSPISPIQISGKPVEEISLFPNHYYDHVFIFLHRFSEGISYSVYKDEELLETKPVNSNFFFLNLLDFPIGEYRLTINFPYKTYNYQIRKNY